MRKVEERALYEALPDLWLQHVSREIPWEKQRAIMQAVVRYPRVAVASANSCGKTFIAARLAAWFLCLYRPAIVITTAPTDRQVSEILWREIRAFAAKAKAHGHPLGGKLFQTCRWEFGEDHFAIGFSTNESDPAKFQGFHAPHVLVIADEAAGISEKIFEGITAVLKGAHSRLLAIGNPCPYSKPKAGRIDDGVRRGFVSLRCGRSSASAENLEHLYPMRDGCEPHCSTKRKP